MIDLHDECAYACVGSGRRMARDGGYVRVPMPEGAVVNGIVADAVAAASALREALAGFRLRPGSAVRFTVNSDAVFTERLSIAGIKEAHVGQAVRSLLLSKYNLPEDYLSGYTLQRQTAAKENCLVTAVPAKLPEGLRRLAAFAGLRAEAAEPFAFSARRITVRLFGSGKPYICVQALGQRLFLSVFHGGDVYYFTVREAEEHLSPVLGDARTVSVIQQTGHINDYIRAKYPSLPSAAVVLVAGETLCGDIEYIEKLTGLPVLTPDISEMSKIAGKGCSHEFYSVLGCMLMKH